MGLAVGGVVELVGPEPAALLREALGDPVVVGGILVWGFRYGYHLRAQGAEQADLFRGLVVRDELGWLRSNDSGVTWSAQAMGLGTTRCCRLLAHPSTQDTLYAATPVPSGTGIAD